jgi:hypothetical protein
MGRSPTLGGFLVVAALVTPGCKGLKTGAREEFAKKFSCPDDRVQVVERADLHAYDVIHGDRDTFTKAPPEEVAADPGRLAKWKADHDESDDRNRSYYNSAYTVFEVSGCDHEVLMACTHPGGVKGGTRMDRVSCNIQKEDDPDSPKHKKKKKKSKGDP